MNTIIINIKNIIIINIIIIPLPAYKSHAQNEVMDIEDLLACGKKNKCVCGWV